MERPPPAKTVHGARQIFGGRPYRRIFAGLEDSASPASQDALWRAEANRASPPSQDALCCNVLSTWACWYILWRHSLPPKMLHLALCFCTPPHLVLSRWVSPPTQDAQCCNVLLYLGAPGTFQPRPCAAKTLHPAQYFSTCASLHSQDASSCVVLLSLCALVLVYLVRACTFQKCVPAQPRRFTLRGTFLPGRACTFQKCVPAQPRRFLWRGTFVLARAGTFQKCVPSQPRRPLLQCTFVPWRSGTFLQGHAWYFPALSPHTQDASSCRLLYLAALVLSMVASPHTQDASSGVVHLSLCALVLFYLGAPGTFQPRPRTPKTLHPAWYFVLGRASTFQPRPCAPKTLHLACTCARWYFSVVSLAGQDTCCCNVHSP